MPSSNIEMIQLIAAGLDELNKQVVYVGGSVTELYANQIISEDIRVTEDVDIVVQIQSQHDYYDLEERLRKKGFTNDTSDGAPICRWLYKSVKLDLMPDDSAILGFSNKWYSPGIENKISYELVSGQIINILPVEFYLATKLEAVFGRGLNDLRLSHDFEDVIYILDNNKEIESRLEKSDALLLKYLSLSFEKLKEMVVFEEAVECLLPYGSDDRVSIVLNRISEIINKR